MPLNTHDVQFLKDNEKYCFVLATLNRLHAMAAADIIIKDVQMLIDATDFGPMQWLIDKNLVALRPGPGGSFRLHQVVYATPAEATSINNMLWDETT